MHKTPPPLPANQPPPLPNNSAKPGRHTPFEAAAVSRSIIKVWFSVAIIAGIASGRLKDEWQSLSSKETPEAGLAYVTYAAAVVSFAGLISALLYLDRRPALEELLGMRRSYWYAGMPLAWLFGFGAGMMWHLI